MCYVICPACAARVTLAADFESHTVSCDDCQGVFDFRHHQLRHHAHDLMPAELAKQIPALYATEDQAAEQKIAHVKLFTPDSSWTWWVFEFCPTERLCFGLVHGHEKEWGYFSLKELEEARGPLGLKIERDLYWKPKPLSQFPDARKETLP